MPYSHFLWTLYGKVFLMPVQWLTFTLSWRGPFSYRNQSMDWFLYDNGLRHERVKEINFHGD